MTHGRIDFAFGDVHLPESDGGLADFAFRDVHLPESDGAQLTARIGRPLVSWLLGASGHGATPPR